MESERYYNTPIFKDEEQTEITHYSCGWCLDYFREGMHFDHTINGNICQGCLEDEDHQSKLSMNNYEYYVYKTRVLKSKPVEL